jgi:hypothetical protein
VIASTAQGAVYRALIGGYETLREEPVAAESRLPFICFTDDPDLTSETWEIVRVTPRLADDPIRSARHLKLCGHERLAGFDHTLWVDNTVELLVPPEEFLDDWLVDADVAAPLHSVRQSVLGEAEAVIDLGKDDQARVYEQLAAYTRSAPTTLEGNPHWTGLLARRRTPPVEAAMQAWWEQVLRYSRRDQLSFSVVMAGSGLRLNSVPLPNRESPLHRWPRAERRRADRPGDSLRAALRPPLAAIGVLQEEQLRLVAEGTAVAADRDRWREDAEKLGHESADAELRARELEAEVAGLAEQLGQAEAREREAAERLAELERLVGELRTRVNRQRGRRRALEGLVAEHLETPLDESPDPGRS